MLQRANPRAPQPVNWRNPFTVPFCAPVPRAVVMDAKPKRGTDIVLSAVQPSVKLQIQYAKEVKALLAEMNAEIQALISKLHIRHQPLAAHDAKPLPANKFQKELEELTAKWNKKFDKRGKEISDWLTERLATSGDLRLANQLKAKGLPRIKFKMTRQQRDVMQAIVNENVGLITSIPEKYLGQVQGAVMRSVASGGDQEQLVKDIQKIYGVEKKRAEFISRDQLRKANNALQRSRQLELGVVEAIWMHSSASKTPRKTHVKANGKRYDIKKGMWDPDAKQYVMPGQLINCKCSSRPVIPGM